MARTTTSAITTRLQISLASCEDCDPKPNYLPSEVLQFNDLIAHWLLTKPEDLQMQIAGAALATEENVVFLDELWKLCADNGIRLTVTEKVQLFEVFLNDRLPA